MISTPTVYWIFKKICPSCYLRPPSISYPRVMTFKCNTYETMYKSQNRDLLTGETYCQYIQKHTYMCISRPVGQLKSATNYEICSSLSLFNSYWTLAPCKKWRSNLWTTGEILKNYKPQSDYRPLGLGLGNFREYMLYL